MIREQLKTIYKYISEGEVLDQMNIEGIEASFKDFTDLMAKRLEANNGNFKASVFQNTTFRPARKSQ